MFFRKKLDKLQMDAGEERENFSGLKHRNTVLVAVSL